MSLKDDDVPLAEQSSSAEMVAMAARRMKIKQMIEKENRMEEEKAGYLLLLDRKVDEMRTKGKTSFTLDRFDRLKRVDGGFYVTAFSDYWAELKYAAENKHGLETQKMSLAGPFKFTLPPHLQQIVDADVDPEEMRTFVEEEPLRSAVVVGEKVVAGVGTKLSCCVIC